MEFLSDILLATAAIGAAIFCLVLSRRLRALTALDGGMGSAIAILSAQVDDLARALKSAQATARESAEKLDAQTRRAEAACRQIELLMAALHDLPEAPARPGAQPPQGPADTRHAHPPSRWTGSAAPRATAPSARGRASGAEADTAEPVAPSARGPRLLRRRPGSGAQA